MSLSSFLPQYSFTPSIMTTHTENTSTGTDDEGGTWTLTRVWEDSADYEFSSIIDRCKRSINMLKKPIFFQYIGYSNHVMAVRLPMDTNITCN